MFIRLPDVTKKSDREAIRRALSLPDIRAFVIAVGVLDTLPTNRARERVLRFVADQCEEHAEAVRQQEIRAALDEAEALEAAEAS